MKPGVTLLETTVVLVLAGILCGLLVPNVTRVLDRLAVRGAATEVRSALALGRHAAVARASHAAVRIDSDAGEILVRVGQDTLEHREIARLFRVSMRSNRDSVAYSPIGLGYGATNQTIIITRGAIAESIVVSRLGRVRTK